MTNVTKLFPVDANSAERSPIARVPAKKGLRTVEIAVPGSQVERMLRIAEALARGESWRSALEMAGLSTDMLDSIGVVSPAPMQPPQVFTQASPVAAAPSPPALPVSPLTSAPVQAAAPTEEFTTSAVEPVGAIPSADAEAFADSPANHPVGGRQLQGFIDYPPMVLTLSGICTMEEKAPTPAPAARPATIELRPTRDDRIPSAIDEDAAVAAPPEPAEEIELTWQFYLLIGVLGVMVFGATLFVLGRL